MNGQCKILNNMTVLHSLMVLDNLCFSEFQAAGQQLSYENTGTKQQLFMYSVLFKALEKQFDFISCNGSTHVLVTLSLQTADVASKSQHLALHDLSPCGHHRFVLFKRKEHLAVRIKQAASTTILCLLGIKRQYRQWK